jgi:chromosome segregation ATPase
MKYELQRVSRLAGKEHPMSTRDLYVEKIKAQIDRWNAEIDKFQAQARQAAADVRIEYEEQVANLKGRRDALEERLAALQRAGDEAWEDLQGGAEKALAGFKEALTRARSRFSAH